MTQIRDLAHRLLGAPSPTPAIPTAPALSATVDAVNASGRGGLAGAIQRTLAGKGFIPGIASTGIQRRTRSVIYYGSDGSGAAAAAATLLGGLPVVSDSSVEVGHLKVVLGSGFAIPAALATAVAQSPPRTPGPGNGPVAAPTQRGTDITTLDTIAARGIPCVT